MLEGRDKQRFVLWGLCCWALYSVLFYNWNISTGERNLCLTHSTLKAVVLSARRRSMNVYEIDEWTHKNEHSYSACVWWVHVFLGVCAHVCVSINAHGSYRLMSVWSSLTFHPIYLFIYLYLFIILFYYLFIYDRISHKTQNLEFIAWPLSSRDLLISTFQHRGLLLPTILPIMGVEYLTLGPHTCDTSIWLAELSLQAPYS